MKKLLYSLLALILLIITACQSGAGSQETSSESTSGESGQTLTVATTFYPVYAFTQEVAGDLADVNLIVEGSDVHGYEPSAKDIARIQESDAFVYANPEMETWVPSVLENIDETAVKVVQVDEGLELLENGEDSHDHDDHEDHDHNHDAGGHDHSHTVDPHTWLDPVNAIEQVKAIQSALIELDPDHEAEYTANADAFIAELEKINLDYQNALSDAENKTFVTQHAAFGYLADRYDLDQVSLAGLSSESEASAQRMAEVTQLIQDNNLPVVYYNSTDSSQLAETVAQEAGVETAILHSLESVDEPDSSGGQDYLQIMKDNLDALKLSIQ